MKNLYLFFLLLFSFNNYSQTRGCLSSYDFDALPLSLQQNLNNLNFTPPSSLRGATENQKSEAVIMIPVVVHVVHRTDEQNISDAVIRNQIEILNNDFRRRNTDVINTPSVFASLAADTKIQFYLACKDPQGNPHSGIIRKRTNHTNSEIGSANKFVVEDNTIAFDSEGGSNSWDNTKYLNIYIADFFSRNAGDNILGVGHFPHQTYTLKGQSPNASRSNVVSIVQINYRAFGSGQNYLINGANFGRTATHEIGHWLALRHIWGDENGCSGSDSVDDTPNQATASPFNPNSCLTHPKSDNCSSAIMFMNYMDYSADNCMNMFTNGQKTRMRNCLDPNTSADVRRTFTYDKIYLESSSTVEFLNANEERTFTLRGAGSSGIASWSVSSGLDILNQTSTSLTVKAKDNFTTAWIQASVNNFGLCSNISIPNIRFDFSIRPTIILGLCDNPNLVGAKDKITCDEISGWAFNSLDIFSNSQVEVYVDNNKITSLIANTYKQYPNAVNFPANLLNLHGFTYSPPSNASWKDGNNHEISLRGCVGLPNFAIQILNCPAPTIVVTNCNYTEGQLLTDWFGEIVRAYKCGTKWYAMADGGLFKPKSWLEATGRFSASESNCFEQEDPRPAGCSGGGTCTSPAPTITANPTSINAGQSSTLTASGCSGTITWNDGTTGSSKTVNSAGTYTATCTNSGCSISNTSSITISSLTVTNCNYTEGQLLTDWFGEIVRAYKCGTKWYAMADGGLFKPKSWLVATNRFSTSESNCFEQEDPRPAGCATVTYCNYTQGQLLTDWFGEIVRAYKCGTKWYAMADGGLFKPKSWLVATNRFSTSESNCFEQEDPRPAGCATGICNYTQGQLLTDWFGEIVRAYKCGTKWYAMADGGLFKPKSWLVATERFSTSESNCFEQEDPRPAGCAAVNSIPADNPSSRNATVLEMFQVNQSQETNDKLTVSPNPTEGKVQAEFSIAKAQAVRLSVIDIQGKTISIHDKDADAGYNRMELDLQNLASGTYIIQLRLMNKQLITKIIKL